MDKIYSRLRFTRKTGNTKKRKIIKIFIIILIIVIVLRMMLKYIDPMFEKICEEKAKSLTTIITNEQSTIVMNKYQYEELYKIEKDEQGNIVIIQANIAPMNNLMSDLAENIQNEFDKVERTKIKIPLGSLTGTYLLSGAGPDISIQVVIVGSIDTNVKSEFINQGINQTLHRVYVDLNCRMKILTPLKSFEKEISNQVIIAEHIIVGSIPDSYYSFDFTEK